MTQFTPYSWTSYRWGYTQSLSRFIFVFAIVISVSYTERVFLPISMTMVYFAVVGAGTEHVLSKGDSVDSSQPHLQLLPSFGLCLQWILCHEGNV